MAKAFLFQARAEVRTGRQEGVPSFIPFPFNCSSLQSCSSDSLTWTPGWGCMEGDVCVCAVTPLPSPLAFSLLEKPRNHFVAMLSVTAFQQHGLCFSWRYEVLVWWSAPANTGLWRMGLTGQSSPVSAPSRHKEKWWQLSECEASLPLTLKSWHSWTQAWAYRSFLATRLHTQGGVTPGKCPWEMISGPSLKAALCCTSSHKTWYISLVLVLVFHTTP